MLHNARQNFTRNNFLASLTAPSFLTPLLYPIRLLTLTILRPIVRVFPVHIPILLVVLPSSCTLSR